MSIDKQALREAAEKATGSHDRLSVLPADDIFDISQHEGTQLDADIAAVNVFNEAANPATVLALLDALEAAQKRIAELEEESAELKRFKEVMTKAAEALKEGKPLNLESLFKGELASAMFAMMFAGEFKRSGAKNYLELLYDVPEFGELTVTIQKVEGKTPGQRIAELEESHAQVIHSRDHYKRVADEGIQSLAEARTLTVKLPDDGLDDCYDLWGPEQCRNNFDCGYNFSAVRHEEAFREACAAAGIQLKVEESGMANKLNIRAENVEPGDLVITSEDKRYTVKSFWMQDDIVTLFGTDGSENDYDYCDMLNVERE